MFTGIVEQTGSIISTREVPGGRRLRLAVGEIEEGTVLGASICVSGVCLTVARIEPPELEFDVVAETLEQSTLGDKRAGAKVNLERSLRVGDRVDGHFVQGHVDGVARVTRVQASEREWRVWLEAPAELHPYLIPKGSVALDGVSLTIAEVARPEFCVALIPTTLGHTTLAALKVGDRVNLETDILVRAVVHQLGGLSGTSEVTLDTLREAGFL